MWFKTLKFLTLFTVFALPLTLLGGPGLITFQSRIVKPDGSPLEAGAVNFRFSVTDTVGSCVIYQEDFTAINMASSKGLVTLSLGAGSKVFPAGPMPLTNVFNNFGSPLFNCQAGGTINAGLTDRRKLVMQFHDGTGWQTLPAMDINSNPFAMQASNAFALGGFAANDFLRPASLTPCNPATHALTFNGTSFTCVAVGGGGGTVTSVTSANADIGVATGASTPVLTLNSGVGPDQILKLNGSSQIPAVDGSLLTGVVAAGIANDAVTSAKILNDEIVNADINSAAAIARTKLANGTANQVVINDGSGVMSGLACTSGQVLKFDGSGVPICGTDNNAGGTVTGTGTTNAIPRFTAAGAIGDSALVDNGTVVTSSRAIASIPNTVAVASVNLALSNTHTLAAVGGASISITGQTNGGVYNIVVSDTTSRTYTFSGCTTSYFKPANAATTAATRTIYGLMTLDNGAGGWDCYVTWSSGFQ